MKRNEKEMTNLYVSGVYHLFYKILLVEGLTITEKHLYQLNRDIVMDHDISVSSSNCVSEVQFGSVLA
ncbi:hypothetical protein J7293_02056 [Nakaseomyces glabratus]|nr:hypothetical protein J7294_02061 [Nakaseomyces glabratus]KAH7607083.1 hypothetical protein J7293_02056 [Nakaseomyces glabratus]